jgi:uncharacterized protein YbjT (DUF2867 family)
MEQTKKPVVLVIGATGLTGSFLIKEFDRDSSGVHVRLAARRQEQVDRFKSEKRDAVLLDLDDPRSFGAALSGVDRLFLVTGYTVAMLSQGKTLVDAAKKAAVRHIVHLGIFGNWDTTDPHFVWHQLIEKYIEASGIAWTHLHPNVFMELLPVLISIENDSFPVFWGPGRLGWTSSEELAAVTATVLKEGPDKHGGQDYWLSADVANGQEIAEIASEVLNRKITAELKRPEDFPEHMARTSPRFKVEPWYGAAILEFLKQVADGRMGYIGTLRDDGPSVTGRPSMMLREWAGANRHRLEKVA